MAVKLKTPEIKPIVAEEEEEIPEVKIYTGSEAKQIGVTIPEGWQIEIVGEEFDLRTATGNIVTQAQLEELIKSGVVDIPGDIYEPEFITLPSGQVVPKTGLVSEVAREIPLVEIPTQIERLRAIERPEEIAQLEVEARRIETAEAIARVFPEMELAEVADYYFPEVEDIEALPPEERVRVEEQQRLATKRFDEFLSEIREAGKTTETVGLLQNLFPEITEAQINSIFLMPDIGTYEETVTEIRGRYPKIEPYIDPETRMVVIPEEVKDAPWFEQMHEELRQAYIDYGVGDSAIKNAWDAFIVSGRTLVHKTAQFFTSTVPQFFLGEGGYGDVVKDLAGYERPFSESEFAVQTLDTFKGIYFENEMAHKEWLERHPELQPKEEYIKGTTKHPELWQDPGWYMYVIAENVPFTLGVLGATLGTFVISKNPIISIAAGTAFATPFQSYDLYEDLVSSGAPTGTAGLIAVPVGFIIASIEAVTDLPLLGALNPAFKLFTKSMQKAIVERTALNLLKQGVKTFTIIEIVEALEEVVQSAIQNATVKFFDENRQIFENVDQTIIQTLIATLPFAVFGGIMTTRHVGMEEAAKVPTAQKLKDGWEQDSITGEWYVPIRLVDKFKEDVEGFKKAGASEEQANLKAYNEAARTPEGEKAISDYVEKEIKVPEEGVYRTGDVFTTPEGDVTLDFWAASRRQWSVIAPDGTSSYMAVGEINTMVDERAWVKKPAEVAIIPEIPEKIDELSALHIHPARTEGFKVSTRADINDYLNRLQALAQSEAPRQVPMAMSAIRSFREGDLSAAAITAEDVLSKIHKKRTVTEPGFELKKRVRTPKIDKGISEIEGLLDKPGKLPKGVGTREGVQIELAELQAKRNASEFQTPGTFRNIIEDIQTELLARDTPYHAGIKNKFPQYTTKQLDAQLKVYKEAETRFLKKRGVDLTKPIKSLEDMTPAEVKESKLIVGEPKLTLEQSDALIGFFGEYIADPNVETAWELTRELRRETRAGRAKQLKARAQELIIKDGLSTEEAMKQAIKETLAGELPAVRTEYLSNLTEELRDALFSKLYYTLKNEPFEMASTATALTNALRGKPIPREVGIKGGSAYTRLERVFGKQPKVFHAIEQGAEKGMTLENTIEGVYREFGQPPIPVDQETADYLRGLKDAVIKEAPLIELVPVTRLDKIVESTFAKVLPNLTYAEKQTISRVLKEALLLPMDIGNFLRANIASFDMSFWRQVKTLTPGHPVAFYRGNIEAWKALFSQKSAEANWEWVKTRPSYPYYVEMVERTGNDFLRMFIVPKGTAQWKAAEEFGHLTEERLIPRWTAKIPWIKWSGRAFVTGINTVDMLVYDDCLKSTLRLAEKYATGEKTLKKGESLSIQKEMDDYGRYITDLTQRASLGRAAPLAPALNSFFFATRSKLGRLLTPRHLISANPRVRALAWKDLGLFVTTFAGLVMLGKWLDLWDVETDPRSGEFMSIRIGTLRIDPWAGNRQFVVLYARLFTGTGVSSVTGIEYEADPIKALVSFTRTSLAPLASILADFWTGRNFLGEEVDIANKEQWLKRIAPFAVQDVWEAFEADWQKGTISILPAIFGEGVQTYTGDWEENFTKIGLPKYEENTAYGITEPVYDVKDFWADVASQFRDVELSNVTEAKGYPEYIRSIVEARNVILPQVNELPNIKLYQMNADPSVGTTFIQYYQMWRDREKIVFSKDEEALTAFDSDERTRNAYLGNITQRQYSLLIEYNSLLDKDKADFLEKHPELDENLREAWLKAHPKENATLAIWGQAKIVTEEAFNIAEKMIADLDIPESAIREYIPSREIMIPYFEYQDIVSDYGASSSEAKLHRINNPEFQTWGIETQGWGSLEDENIKVLELNVKLRKQDDKYDAIQYENESKQREERSQYLEDNPEYADDRRRRDFYSDNLPEEFIEQYVEYYRLPLGKARTNYRREHPEFSAMMEDPAIRGDDAWKPISGALTEEEIEEKLTTGIPISELE